MNTALVCSNDLFAAAIRAWLAESPLTILAAAASPAAVVSRVRQEGQVVDLVLVATSAPLAELAPELPRCRLAFPESRWLLIDNAFCLERMGLAFALGFDGYQVGTPSREGLIAAAQLLGSGGKVFPADLVEFLRRPSPAFRLQAAALAEASLTQRERAVAGCLGAGLSDKEIATELGLAPSTVATHLKALRRKLKLANRTQIALWAVGVTQRAKPRLAASA